MCSVHNKGWLLANLFILSLKPKRKQKEEFFFFYVFILLFSLAVCVYVVVFFDNPLYEQWSLVGTTKLPTSYNGVGQWFYFQVFMMKIDGMPFSKFEESTRDEICDIGLTTKLDKISFVLY